MNKDQSVDRLLQRAGRAGEPDRTPSECLDPETLAAWTARSLTAPQRAIAETHLADCERCLTILGAIAQTTPPPSKSTAARWLSIRWLVPLGTAVVGLLAWVVVQREPYQSSVVAPPPAAVSIEEKSSGEKAIEGKKPESAAATPASPAAKRDRVAAPQAAADALLDKTQSRDKLEPQRKEQLQARSTNESLRKDAQLSELRREAPKDVALIVSPQPSVQWRIDGRSVQRSTDAGASWQSQATGAAVQLLAGSSPSPTVCWIVGRSGTVLLSTDGATWRSLTFPQPTVDIVRVTATDDVSATVTTATGSVYRTVDAGRTWTLRRLTAKRRRSPAL